MAVSITRVCDTIGLGQLVLDDQSLVSASRLKCADRAAPSLDLSSGAGPRLAAQDESDDHVAVGVRHLGLRERPVRVEPLRHASIRPRRSPVIGRVRLISWRLSAVDVIKDGRVGCMRAGCRGCRYRHANARRQVAITILRAYLYPEIGRPIPIRQCFVTR